MELRKPLAKLRRRLGGDDVGQPLRLQNVEFAVQDRPDCVMEQNGL
jgi:hypothetical protein